MTNVTIPRPYDMHVHFRQGEMLKRVVPYWTDVCAGALIMPNTQPAIITANDLIRYRNEVASAFGDGDILYPLMTFELREDSPSTLEYFRFLKDAGAVAGKAYPKNMTTNSTHGVSDYAKLWPMFSIMQDLEIVACFHGEHPGDRINDLSKEEKFIDEILDPTLREFPSLRVVLEHITSKKACDFVEHSDHERLAATITTHHLFLSDNDVGGSPGNFCRPRAKLFEDLDSLVATAISGSHKFFWGSDSAPHPMSGKKRLHDCCAGIFVPPFVALPLMAELFKKHGELENLQKFVHDNAVSFYGLPPSKETITLQKENMTVPELLGFTNENGEADPVPIFWGEREIGWSIQDN